MVKILSKINITNMGRPVEPTRSAMVSKPPGPEVTIGNTSGAEVPSLPNDDRMLLEEEEWNELFENSREFTNFEWFLSAKSEEMKAENISENTSNRKTKEVYKQSYALTKSIQQKEGIESEWQRFREK